MASPLAPDLDVVVVGGCGRVGLPLAIAFASRGLRVGIHDVDAAAVAVVSGGTLPFQERGAGPLLTAAIESGRLEASTDPAIVSRADAVVVAVGTPVDEHLNPDPRAVGRTLASTLHHFRDGQLLVLRSTVYPGVTRTVEELVARRGLEVDVAFCPERIAEGEAMTELFTLPQIVSGRSPDVLRRAGALFQHLTDTVVDLAPEEAELAKLFTNAWRYLKFAAANQFYVMANNHDLDFERIRRALTHGYPRAADLPGAGFAAGPCLFKDTMQLAAFSDNSFALGHSAMLVNEGLPLYVVSALERKVDLRNTRVGILGMAFKAESDDIRSSLSYKLKRILEFRAAAVLTTDPYVTVDPHLSSFEEVVAGSDVLIIATPHRLYRDLASALEDKHVVDVWDLLGRGTTA